MDDFRVVMDFLEQYGMWFLFVIIFLEHLNLPGFAAGIIMPAAGLMIAQTGQSFLWALLVSIAAGMAGSIVLYVIGYFIGAPVLDFIYRKIPATQKSIDKVKSYTDKYGNRGIFITRLVPVARTIVSLVVGIAKMKLLPFCLYSVGGIAICNFLYIIAGYLFGNLIFGLI